MSADSAGFPARATVFLLTTDQPWWRYTLKIAVTGLLVAIGLALLLSALLYVTGLSDLATDQRDLSGLKGLLVVVVVAPLVETLMLALGLRVLRNWLKQDLVLAAVSAVLWGLLHAPNSILNGVVVIPSFFLQSCAYIAWRRHSFAHAYWTVVSIHAFNNGMLWLLQSLPL